ncbi:MAG: hypothetical protein QM831_14025 [Kofleriaceae bacterium]
MTYRNDVEALAARTAVLEQEVAAKTQERDEAARMLHEAKARAKLPVLDNIRVASPCRADWNQMVGDERVRHCGDCKKDVFNISQMTREEAQALVVEKAGNLCVRYFQRYDGTILLADCTIGKSRARKRRVIAAGALALLSGGVTLSWALSRREEKMCHRVEALGGAVAIQPAAVAHLCAFRPCCVS